MTELLEYPNKGISCPALLLPQSPHLRAFAHTAAVMVLLARRALAPRPGAAETVPAIPHNLGCSSPSAYARARNITPW